MTKPGYATVIMPETTYTKITELAKQWNKSKSAVLAELVNSRPAGMIPSTFQYHTVPPKWAQKAESGPGGIRTLSVLSCARGWA